MKFEFYANEFLEGINRNKYLSYKLRKGTSTKGQGAILGNDLKPTVDWMWICNDLHTNHQVKVFHSLIVSVLREDEH